mmetsp:Transcript_4941/g.11623  ORF Transcript_4941/g.11623 Transcript_4941/m.11623 type:complete len:111 (+) Transcript_4941:524-856(+)
MEAMRRAVSDVRGQLAKAAKGKPSGEKSVVVAVDGNRVPKGIDQAPGVTAEAIVKGDSKILSIAAASILAKVTRDRAMVCQSVHGHRPAPRTHALSQRHARTPVKRALVL